MSRLSLVVLKRDERAVLRHLGAASVCQITRAPFEAGMEAAPGLPAGKPVRWERIFTRLENLRRVLPRPAEDEPIPAEEISPAEAEQRLDALEAQVRAPLQRREQLQQRLAQLAAAQQQVSPYGGTDWPLDRPEDSDFLHFVTGTLPAENFGNLKTSGRVALMPLATRNGRLCLMALTTQTDHAGLDRALRLAGFEPEKLPAMAGTTTDALLEQNRREQTRLTAELEQLNAGMQNLAREFAPACRQIELAAENEWRLAEAARNFFRTESSVLITGWIPSACAPGLQTQLEKITGGHGVVRIAPAPDIGAEEIPVLLRPPRWLRPFQRLVEAYGLPKYREVEPTLFVAASFVLMFGMMFGDVGQGAVLAAGGLAAVLAGRTQKMRDTGWLLLAAGCASAVLGFVFGSCFGVPAFKPFALWPDPLEGAPMRLMSTAIAAGVVMISLALGLNILNRFRNGDWIGGWLGRSGVAGLVFYWGALALLTKFQAIQSGNLLAPAIFLFLVLPMAGWALKEPLEYLRDRRVGRPAEPDEGWFNIIAQSLVGVFEAVMAFLANTISFVRLAAYAMSHAALLAAVFLLADAVKAVPVAGAILSVLVIVLGNAVAIALEGVIAGVQALRLEYYEFFSRFFSGAGRRFEPFRLQPQTVAERHA